MLILSLTISLSVNSFSQSIIAWTPEYTLALSDFQSAQTEINGDLSSYAIFPGTSMDFLFQMSSYEFMFTKNFNSKVNCTFNRNVAVITAPDSIIAQQLVRFGQFTFDLAELFSRKFRKELYEQKGAFSSASFFQPIYNELQAKMNEISARVLKQTDLGREKDLLQEEHRKILTQIESLSDYCKECKPPKRKKKRK